MTIDEWRAIIAYAIGVVRENGWRIEPGINVDPEMGICCPLGALYLVNSDRPLERICLKDVSDTIDGLTFNHVAAFAVGFDDESRSTWPDPAVWSCARTLKTNDFAWWKLGADFRRAILEGMGA